MALVAGIVALVFAAVIAAVAGWFSVTGLAALFAAAALPVMIMGGVLEVGKLVAAAWLHANWRNPRVGRLHKAYLGSAVAALMLITAIGIYGFLSKGYLDQSAPLGAMTLQIEQREAAIQQRRDEVQALDRRQAQLDAAVNSLIEQQRVFQSQKLRDSQRAERQQIAHALESANTFITVLTRDTVQMKTQASEAGAKLGPLKYVAALFGGISTDSAVRTLILILMFAFDPLAVVLVLSGTISLADWAAERKAEKATQTAQEAAPAVSPLSGGPTPEASSLAAQQAPPPAWSYIKIDKAAAPETPEPIAPVVSPVAETPAQPEVTVAPKTWLDPT